MTYVAVSPKRGGVASVILIPTEQGVAYLPVHLKERGVASVAVSPKHGGVASMPFSHKEGGSKRGVASALASHKASTSFILDCSRLRNVRRQLKY